MPPPYNFSPAGEACSWLAPVVGAVLGQLWGHWFNDWLCRRFVQRHNGIYVLENRLWACYAPTLLFLLALVLYGQALQHSLHWAILLVAWALVAFGIVACTTAVSAYILGRCTGMPHVQACADRRQIPSLIMLHLWRVSLTSGAPLVVCIRRYADSAFLDSWTDAKARFLHHVLPCTLGEQ